MNSERHDRSDIRIVGLHLAVETQAILVFGTRQRDELLARGGVEMSAEPQRHEQWKPQLLAGRRLLEPRVECALAGGSDGKWSPVTGPRRSGLDEPARLERGQLAIHMALRHVPE